jgi:hypothetical protein
MLKGTGIEEWLARMQSRPSMQATQRDRLTKAA